jgi:tetratricopeptide (TPR) repeat protein
MSRLCRFLLVFLLFAPASFAQIGSGAIRKSISGYIREAGTGHVIVSARLDLLNAMGSPVDSTYSDGNGMYQFNEIVGDCYVEIHHDGYSPLREFVRPEGAPDVKKDFFLQPLAGASTPSGKNPVSEHELGVPPKARQSFDKGVQLIVEKSDYHAAVAEFQKAIDKYSDYYEAYAAMGLAQSKMGDAAAAEASLRHSVEMSNEKYPQALIDLGSLLNAAKRFSEAEPLLRSAVSLDATSWRAQYELATALSGEKKFALAIPIATAARDAQSDNPQTYLLLYTLHIETDNYSAAVADIDGYLKISPSGPMADRVRKLRDQIQKQQLHGAAASANPPPTSPNPHPPF